MKRTGQAAAIILALSALGGGARAQSTCAVGADSVTYSPDRGAISVLFDFFEADAVNDARCDLAVPTLRGQDENTFSVYSADVSGFVNEGDTAEVEQRQGGTSAAATVSGPRTGSLLRSYVGTNGGATLDSTILLRLARAGDPFSFAGIDTLDYALAATATLGDLESSLDGLGTQRTAALVRLRSVAGLLTGIDRPLDRADEVRLLGAGGSFLAGAAGRWSVSDALTLEGGAAAIGLPEEAADARGAVAAATLRWLAPGEAASRPFAEAGANVAPLKLRFARGYDDATENGAQGSGAAHGLAGGVHAGAGILFRPDAANQVAVSAAAAQGWLATRGYAEGFGDDNLFAASFGSETTGLATLKLGAAWTAAVTPAFDVTLNAAAGHGFAGGILRADVSFAGAVQGRAGNEDFVEYGARLGYRPGAALGADLFAQGVSGRESGTHVFWGGSLGRSF